MPDFFPFCSPMDNEMTVCQLSAQMSGDWGLGDQGSNAAVEEKSSHPRINLYKNRGRAGDQERRWRAELEAIREKKRRQEKFDSNRKNSMELLLQNLDERESAANPWSSKRVSCTGKSWRSYSHNLMLAEWLLFMPPTFADDYLLKLCPKGRHVLVRAAYGATKIYSRTGYLLFRTQSRLPGGGLGQSEHQSSANSTVLDCIMIRPENSLTEDLDGDLSVKSSPILMYVVDVIYFRKTCYTELPFRERCSWLENYHRSEIEEEVSDDPIRFRVLSSYPCTEESMKTVFLAKPEFDLDGVLFYHEAVRYKPGATPLVGWLKPYMLAEWFPSLQLHPDYSNETPEDYTNYLNEIRHQEESASLRTRSYKKSLALSPGKQTS
ncbi:unnamed protein product [Calicophoron daubneyi]|uniref:Snurportin-1 n=1 Tax=Calicophoron daubneyi TaxID=300641 RepID=A0AAV2TG34_CALDB